MPGKALLLSNTFVYRLEPKVGAFSLAFVRPIIEKLRFVLVI